jgi:hypothetical protein
VPEHLTVGSLIGLPLGTTPAGRAGSPTPVSVAGAHAGAEAAAHAAEAGAEEQEIEGPNWSIAGGEVGHGGQAAWRGDGVEALTFNNPFGQVMERVWFDGKVVYAVDLGKVILDASKVKVAQEYQPVYAAELGTDGRAVRPPEMVAGQLNIYDTVPGMDRYSPIWQFNYVIVPRAYEANTLRSEADCLASGYPILRSQDFEN